MIQRILTAEGTENAEKEEGFRLTSRGVFFFLITGNQQGSMKDKENRGIWRSPPSALFALSAVYLLPSYLAV
jgi:hypothetical protein